jgi:hypothetical protein
VQVCLAEDQDPVEELAAQGADEALADRVGAGGLEDSVEGIGEVRSAVADQEPIALESLVEGEVAGLLHGPLAW